MNDNKRNVVAISIDDLVTGKSGIDIVPVKLDENGRIPLPKKENDKTNSESKGE